jgi:hypothetical protein
VGSELSEWLTCCDGAVVLVSPEAFDSTWVKKEVAQLMERRNREGARRMRIIPVAVCGLGWHDPRLALTPELSPLRTIQGATAPATDEVIAGLRGLHDLLGLPRGLSRGLALTPNTSPANLLRPAHEAVGFLRREAELEALHAWLEDQVRVSAMLVHGPGGAGKTRLALELIKQWNERGWDAGFLDARIEDLDPLLRGVAPTLIAVDYAEAHTGQLVDFLRRAAQSSSTDRRPKIRVLMLARGADDWWQNLGETDGDVKDMLDAGARTMRLRELAGPEDRSEVWRQTLKSLAEHLNRDVPDERASPIPLDDRFALPLYMQMAALDLLLREAEAQDATSQLQLLDRILGHEWRYWSRWLSDRGETPRREHRVAVEQSLAALTLIGPLNDAALLRTIVDDDGHGLVWSQQHWYLFADLYPARACCMEAWSGASTR